MKEADTTEEWSVTKKCPLPNPLQHLDKRSSNP